MVFKKSIKEIKREIKEEKGRQIFIYFLFFSPQILPKSKSTLAWRPLHV